MPIDVLGQLTIADVKFGSKAVSQLKNLGDAGNSLSSLSKSVNVLQQIGQVVKNSQSDISRYQSNLQGVAKVFQALTGTTNQSSKAIASDLNTVAQAFSAIRTSAQEAARGGVNVSDLRKVLTKELSGITSSIDAEIAKLNSSLSNIGNDQQRGRVTKQIRGLEGIKSFLESEGQELGSVFLEEFNKTIREDSKKAFTSLKSNYQDAKNDLINETRSLVKIFEEQAKALQIRGDTSGADRLLNRVKELRAEIKALRTDRIPEETGDIRLGVGEFEQRAGGSRGNQVQAQEKLNRLQKENLQTTEKQVLLRKELLSAINTQRSELSGLAKISEQAFERGIIDKNELNETLDLLEKARFRASEVSTTQASPSSNFNQRQIDGARNLTSAVQDQTKQLSLQVREQKEIERLSSQINTRASKLREEYEQIVRLRRSAGQTLNEDEQNAGRLLRQQSQGGLTVGSSADLNNTSEDLNKLTKSLRANKKELGDFLRNRISLENFGRAAALAAKRYSAFLLGSFGVVRIVNQFQDATRSALELEASITKIEQVLGTSPEAISGLEGTIRSLAATTGIAANELADGVFFFAQSGVQNLEDLKDLAESLARVPLSATLDGIQATSEGILAIQGQFNLEASDTARILDLVNKFAADFAVESADIFAGVQRGGAAFSIAGGDLEEFIALFSVLRERSRESAETLGTFFKSGSAQFLQESSQQLLRQLGVDSDNLVDQFVELSEILFGPDSSLNEIERINVARQLTGQRQFSRLLGLLQELQDFDVLDRVDVARREALGSFVRETEKRIDDLGQSLSRANESFREFVNLFVDNAAIKGATTALIDFSSAGLRTVNSIEPLIPVISALGISLLGIASARILTGFNQLLRFSALFQGSSGSLGRGFSSLGLGSGVALQGLRSGNFSDARRGLGGIGRGIGRIGRSPLGALAGFGAVAGLSFAPDALGLSDPSAAVAARGGRAFDDFRTRGAFTGATSGALAGAGLGLTFGGPLGASIGAAVGGVTGAFLGLTSATEELRQAQLEAAVEFLKLFPDSTPEERRRRESSRLGTFFEGQTLLRNISGGTSSGPAGATSAGAFVLAAQQPSPVARTAFDLGGVISNLQTQEGSGAATDIVNTLFSDIRDSVESDLLAAASIGDTISAEELNNEAQSRVESAITELIIENIKRTRPSTDVSSDTVLSEIDSLVDIFRNTDSFKRLGEVFQDIEKESNIVGNFAGDFLQSVNRIFIADFGRVSTSISQFNNDLDSLLDDLGGISSNPNEQRLLRASSDNVRLFEQAGLSGFVELENGISDVAQSFVNLLDSGLDNSFNDALAALQNQLVENFEGTEYEAPDIAATIRETLGPTFNNVADFLVGFTGDNFRAVLTQITQALSEGAGQAQIEDIIRNAVDPQNTAQQAADNIRRRVEALNTVLQREKEFEDSLLSLSQIISGLNNNVSSLTSDLEEFRLVSGQARTQGAQRGNLSDRGNFLLGRSGSVGGTGQIISDALAAAQRRNRLVGGANSSDVSDLDQSLQDARDALDAQIELARQQGLITEQLGLVNNALNDASSAVSLFEQAIDTAKSGLADLGSNISQITVDEFATQISSGDQFRSLVGGFGNLGSLSFADQISTIQNALNGLDAQGFQQLQSFLQTFSSTNIGGGLTGGDLQSLINQSLGVAGESAFTGQDQASIISEIERLEQARQAALAEEERLRQDQIDLVRTQRDLAVLEEQFVKDQRKIFNDIASDVNSLAANFQLQDVSSILKDTFSFGSGGALLVTAEEFKAGAGGIAIEQLNNLFDGIGSITNNIDRLPDILENGLERASQTLDRFVNAFTDNLPQVSGENVTAARLDVAPVQVNVALSVPDILSVAGPQLRSAIVQEISVKLAEAFSDQPEIQSRIRQIGVA